MTGDDVRPARGRGDPGGPPWPLELLADLHAGVLDDDVSAELLARVNADPRARATLAALDATRADLAALPPLVMPEAVAARIDAALCAVTAEPASTAEPARSEPDTAPPRAADPRPATTAAGPSPAPAATARPPAPLVDPRPSPAGGTAEPARRSS
jgi:hypothetical protein